MMKTKLFYGVLVTFLLMAFACISRAEVIAEWKFEYNSANPAAFYADSSGNGHTLQDCTLNGSVGASPSSSPLPPIAGDTYCANFAGGNCLQTVSTIDLSSYKAIRVSFWMRNTLPDSIRWIFNTGTTGTSMGGVGSIGMDLNENGAGIGRAYLSSNGGYWIDSFTHDNPATIGTGVWDYYQIEYRLDAATNSTVIQVYKNGVMESTDYQIQTVALPSGFRNENWFLGGANMRYYGQLDDFKIESIETPVGPSVIAEWKFEYNPADSNAFYADSSGNGHNLQACTLNGSVGAGATNSSLPPVPGDAYCADFTGGGKCLQTVNNLDLGLYRHIRVSFWMRNTLPGSIRWIFNTGSTGTSMGGVGSIGADLNENGTGIGRAYLSSNGGYWIDSFTHDNPATIGTGVWDYYQIVYKLNSTTNTEVITVSKNGVVNSTDYQTHTDALPFGFANDTWFLGGANMRYYGQLDNFKIEAMEAPIPPINPASLVTGLTDNFNLSTAPGDVNAQLAIRQTGVTAPNLWENLGTGETPNNSLVNINASKQLQIFIAGPPNYQGQGKELVVGQTDLPQSSQYILEWDQGAIDLWSYAGFNTKTPPITALECGLLFWGPDHPENPNVASFYVNGGYVRQGTFSSPTGENGLHHIKVVVNYGLMTMYIDSESPTWTVDLTNVGTKGGVGNLSFWAAPYEVYGYFDNVSYKFMPPQACGDVGTQYLSGDITGPNGVPDCQVDFIDLATIVSHWLDCTDPADSACVQAW